MQENTHAISRQHSRRVFMKHFRSLKDTYAETRKRSMPLMQILENVYADPYKKTHADSRKTSSKANTFAESRKYFCRV